MRQMIRRCKVGMRSVLEAFRTPSKINEQGMRTLDHMMQDLLQMSCQRLPMKQIRGRPRMVQAGCGASQMDTRRHR